MTSDLVAVSVAALWAVSVLAWRATRRKLGLASGEEWQAKPRRIARMLLAFNFLFTYPAGVSLAVVMLTFGNRASAVVAVYALLNIVAFTLPIPSLVARGRRLPEGTSTRRSVGPSVWLDGIGPTLQDAFDRRNRFLVHCLALMAAAGVLLVVAWLRPSDLGNVAGIAQGLLAFYLLERGQA